MWEYCGFVVALSLLVVGSQAALIKPAENGVLKETGGLAKQLTDGVQLPEEEHIVRYNENGGKAVKLRLGCVPDVFNHTRLKYHVYSSPHNTASWCIKTCRQQHFTRAGVMNGVDCYCGNDEIRGEFAELNMTITDPDLEDQCNINCPGDHEEQCGGNGCSALYSVPEDVRYFGCYKDNPSFPDLSTYQWGANANRSARLCVDTCGNLGFLYSGVQNGGACYCGNSFGRHGEEEEELCDVKCKVYSKQNCGGVNINAIYMTERAIEMGQNPDPLVKILYTENAATTEVSMELFTQHQRLISILTPKIALTVSGGAVGPNYTNCVSNCYTACGEIYHPEGFEFKGSILIIRSFHLNLRNLGDYVAEDTKMVYVYAQTIVMDANLNIDYSLLIRTRELILDQSNGPLKITVDPDVPNLEIEDITKSIEPELLFFKQSIMCARILLDTKNQVDYNKAFEIADDISTTKTTDDEAEAFIEEVYTVMSEMVGLMRADVHYVPVYTKTHMSQILETYHTQISIYKDDFDRIIARTEEGQDYLELVDRMQKIYAETDIEEAQASLDAAIIAVDRANATYHELDFQYIESNKTMEEAAERFEKGLEDKIAEAKRKATRSFIGLMFRVTVGVVRSIFDPSSVKDELEKVKIAMKNLANAMKELSDVIAKVNAMQAIIDELMGRISDITHDYDFMEFADAIEEVVELQLSIVHWQNFKENANIIMSDSELRTVDGADEYHQSMLQTANWGSAMCSAALEVAEAMRIAMEKRLIYDAKLLMQERLDELMEELRNGLIEQEVMNYAMMEQTYDVRLDLNGALITFCQAYFYENLYACKDAYRPSFGGSLMDLLLKINAARKDALLIGSAPSTVARRVRIEDTTSDSSCEDMSSCPVNYFRNHRMFYYIMTMEHKDLWDLDKYRVAEVELHFEGLIINNDVDENSMIKMVIETTGQFNGRSRDVVYDFLSQGLSLLYEYDVNTGLISIKGDVYAPYRDIVSHVTPFTTWVVRVSDDRSHNIDVSQVTKITMTLRGSAVNMGA